MKEQMRDYWAVFRSLPTLRDKLGYLWDYGKLWIIGILCLGSFLGFAVYRGMTAVRENYLYAVFVNTHADVGGDSGLRGELLRFTGWDPAEKNVQLEGNTFFSYLEDGGRGNVYYDAFVSFLDAGVLDAAVMPAEELTAFGGTGRLMDLRDERCSRILAAYGDRLRYAIPLDPALEGKPVPVGIDLTDSPVLQRYALYDQPCALGIGAFTEHIDSVELLLDFLFSEENP